MEIKGTPKLKKVIEDTLRERGFTPELASELAAEAVGRYRENALGPYINSLARSIVPNLAAILEAQGKTGSAKVVAVASKGIGKAILVSAIYKFWKEVYPGVGVRRGKRSGVGLDPAKAADAVWLSRPDLRALLGNNINV